MKRLVLIPILMLLVAGAAGAQVSGDVLGAHNLSLSGTAPIKGRLDPCLYCHVPHSGVQATNPALWSQTLSSQTYSTYSSTTLHNTTQQPILGQDSSLCLSCHDGTVAVGQTQPYGQIQMTGNMYQQDVFGANLQGSHPFSLKLPLVDAADLVPSLVASGTTADPLKAVKLINGDVECTSCHTPHSQAIDMVSQNFLVRDSSSGQMCLSCHDPNPRTVNGQNNPLAQWSGSIHSTAGNAIANPPVLGSYANVAQNACLSCHMPHNSLAGARLLRGPVPLVPNMDPSTQNCITCHNGGSNISPAITNVYAEYTKIAHPFPAGINQHDAAEPPLLNNNRHATCVDCHSPHGSLQTTSFSAVLPPAIRPSQAGVVGISATDGTTVLTPAVNQYENCLRCHGTSTGKQTQIVFGYLPTREVTASDPLNIIPQMATTATSSHPVLHPRSSSLPQPSLLTYMLQLDGKTQGRAMGTQIYCTDCHNADDNREFGGTGPNGPHGSKWLHLLERRYEFSEAPGPGQRITNLFPNPDLSVNGPYAMCGKCHNLTTVNSTASWIQHPMHINAGFSCSTCHTAHGMGASSGNVTGERLINFDLKVVSPNGGIPVSYNRGTSSCSLVCHDVAHYPNGMVQPLAVKGSGKK
ncbi:MAG TPA: cytochrome c3 family protein [Verrucomicrobiae bacterium]|jgi:predicted CXXCH cytochrome family protein|nr:cytochrome c3 family protein [Verrucomicrobiae bacterium]